METVSQMGRSMTPETFSARIPGESMFGANPQELEKTYPRRDGSARFQVDPVHSGKSGVRVTSPGIGGSALTEGRLTLLGQRWSR